MKENLYRILGKDIYKGLLLNGEYFVKFCRCFGQTKITPGYHLAAMEKRINFPYE